jgi:5'-nucleotidase
MGVNIIIVLSHSGFERDKIIAEECGDYVDVIVGGHSHSFLYTPCGAAAVNVHDIPVASYPLVLTPKSGRERKVLVVHASAFTKYVGDLRVYFNAAGYVKYYDGNPIYLSNEIQKDPVIDAELVPWRNEVLRLGERIVGNTSVDLIHTECRHGECRLGNLVADALVSANHGFKNVFSAIIHAAGLRNSFYSGDIHYGDIVAAFPFENTLDVLELRGDMLHEIFEHSVSRSFVEDEFIGIHMLQIAGFKVAFNTTHSVGERVQSLEIKINEKCEYEKVSRNNKLYHVIAPSFLSNGGDGFTMMIKSKRKNQQKGFMLDIDAIESYIALKSPITEDIVEDEQQRIVMLT